MRIKTILSAMVASVTMFASCSSEDEPAIITPEAKPQYLNIQASIAQLTESRAVTIHENFVTNDKMGVWTGNYINSPITYTGTSWDGSLLFSGEGKDVYAVLPFDKNVTDKTSVPVDITLQEDYIYGYGTTSDHANVTLSFKHALSQIKVEIVDAGYTKAGMINSITLKDVEKDPILDITTGKLNSGSSATDIQIGGNYLLSDKLLSTGIFSPSNTNSDIHIIVRIDDVDYDCSVQPINGGWKQGYIYTYKLNIKDSAPSSNDHIMTYDDEDIDVEYWSTYGDEEPVTSVKLEKSWAYSYSVSPIYTHQGFDLYQGKACMFGLYFAPSWQGFGTNNEGDIRLLYIDSKGNIKGQTSSQSFSGTNTKDMYFFDYMNLSPGRYRIMPVVRFKGESVWVAPESDGYYSSWYTADNTTQENLLKDWPDNNWGYTVKESNDDILMCRDMWVESVCYPGHYQLSGTVKMNVAFDINFILTNNSLKEVKGTLIVKDERGFSEKYNHCRPCDMDAPNLEEWSDVIGTKQITIPSGVRNWKDVISVTITRNTAVTTFCASKQHIYFQPEGSEEMYLLIKDWAPVLNEHQTDPSSLTFWGANVTCIHAE